MNKPNIFHERGFVDKIQRPIFGTRNVYKNKQYIFWCCVVLFVLALGMLGGCAADKLNREGLQLLEEGRYEEGLAKLQDAAKAEPDNMNYRIELRRIREQIVNRQLAEAAEERATNHRERAKDIYRLILKLDPKNKRATDGLDELAMDERHDKLLADAKEFLAKDNQDAATAALNTVLLENPKNEQALDLQQQIEDQAAKEQNAGPVLRAQFKKPVTLQFRDANLKMVFEALSRVSGINVLLDKDVKPDIRISLFVKEVSVEDTIDLILMQSQLEKNIVTDNTVFIYPNTPAKVKDYQELMVRSFHLNNADPKQMMTMLKTVLKYKDVYLNDKTNSIVVRDTPEAISLAEKMIADQDVAEPEVMMEVEVLEVNRTRLSDIGIKWPTQLSLTALGSAAVQGAAAATTAPTLTELKHINSDHIITTPSMSVALKAMLQDTDTNILASPRIRARNREKAKIMIGDRVPVITNAVTPVSTGSPVVTGNVQYLDVGLRLEVEPDIRLNNDVAIKINLDVSTIVKEVQNTMSGTLAYQIGTRNASTLLQLKDGETQILAGLINNEQRNSASKVPGLGQLPILGHLFSEHNDNGTKTEIILSITPHVIGKMRRPKAAEIQYWSGTESNLHVKPVQLKPVKATLSLNNASLAPAVTQTETPIAAAIAGSDTANALPATPLVLSWQGPSQTQVGDKISLTLNTQSTLGVKSLGFLVGFDPKVLKAVDVIEGSFLKQGNAPSKLSKVIDQSTGQILVDLSSSAETGASGSGSVIAVVFEVVRGASQSQITTSQILPLGIGNETLAFNAPPPHEIAVR